MEKNKELYEAALRYVQAGFSVVPLGGKKPLIEWKEFQTRRATPEEIKTWCELENITGIGIVTGRISNLVVLDVEKDGDISGREIPPTVSVESGGGGKHFYFKYPSNMSIRSLGHQGLGLKGDLRSDGGQVVAPPSLHPSGNRYKWILDLENDIAELPKWLIDLGTEASSEKKADWSTLIKGVQQGGRHDSATRVIGKLLAHLPQKDWDAIVWPLAQAWNEQNKPPLEEKELFRIFTDFSRKDADGSVQDNPLSLKDLLNIEESPDPFLVHGLIPERGITALSGHPSSGKTWILLEIAIAVASGKDLFDKFNTIQGSVLIVDEENGISEMKRRIQRLGISPNLPIFFYSQAGLKVDNAEHLQKIRKEILEKNIRLVIFDPFVSVHSRSENSAEEIQYVMSCLQELTSVGASVLYIHHHRKDGVAVANANQSLRGSSALSGRADSHIAVEKKKDSDDLTISQEKLRRGRLTDPFVVRLIEEGEHIFLRYIEDGVSKSRKGQIESAIDCLLETGPCTRMEILEALAEEGYKERIASDVIRSMVDKDRIKVEKAGKQNLYSRIEEKAEPEPKEGGRELLEL